MATYLNPGIFVEGISIFPPLVEEVETALPAFIGYTAKATKKVTNDLILVPTRINSMKEFESLFGFPYENRIEVAVATDSSGEFILSGIKEPTLKYILYFSVTIFFENGGETCYILSVGTYQTPQQILLRMNPESSGFGLQNGLDKLSEVAGPSLIVIPEAVKLEVSDYSLLVQATLLQCHQLGDRFAIFDLYHVENSHQDLNLNGNFFGNCYLSFGSAYYPFIKTMINSYVNTEESNVKVACAGETADLGKLKKANTQLYKCVKKELKNRYIILPPGGAVAGVYATTDKNRGVWKSPSNLNLVGVCEPVVNINNHLQNLLSSDSNTTISINSIRTFNDKGTMIWGAHTLDGKDTECRHVSVRRFIIMVKGSLRKSTCWVVFEPNNENTWAKVRLLIQNYLTLKWQEGALAGVTPQQAFFVKCGTGTTMTQQDIVEGRMNIEVGMALLRPAEFIRLRFSHQLKVSK